MSPNARTISVRVGPTRASVATVSERTTAEWLADGERRSQWALAHISTAWSNTISPIMRRAYRESSPTDPAICDEIAERFEGLARTARRAAELAREENEAAV